MHCLLTVRARTVGYKTQGLSTTSRRVLSKQTQNSHGIEMTPQPDASSGRPGFGSWRPPVGLEFSQVSSVH